MAAKSANVNVRVEPEIKEQAEAILDRLGISAASFINMTYRQVIMRNGIPFSVTIPQDLSARDTMTDSEFNDIMQRGLADAQSGEFIPCDEAFRHLLQDL